jgi:hypothetical protein
MVKARDVRCLDKEPQTGQCRGNWKKGYNCGTCSRCRAIAANAVGLLPSLRQVIDELVTALQDKTDKESINNQTDKDTALVRRALYLIARIQMNEP